MKLKTIPQAAAEVGVDHQALRRAVKAGAVASMPLGNRMMVELDGVRAWRDGLEGNGLISIDTLSEEIGLSCGAIRRGMDEGWIPYRVVRGAFRFDLDAVVAAITERMR